MKNLLLLGGGGHCLTVLDSLAGDAYGRIGIVDLPQNAGNSVAGIRIVGVDDDLAALRGEYTHAFVSLGGRGAWMRRKRLSQKARNAGYEMPCVVHPCAVVSPSAWMDDGVLAAPGAVVNARCEIGAHCILNSGCIVEHENRLAAFVHVAPGAVLCGNVAVGEGSHIGANAVVRQGVTIGGNSLVGIGSVVTKDVPDDVVAYGNPCRVIRMKDFS